jgi:hypothetical protein
VQGAGRSPCHRQWVHHCMSCVILETARVLLPACHASSSRPRECCYRRYKHRSSLSHGEVKARRSSTASGSSGDYQRPRHLAEDGFQHSPDRASAARPPSQPGPTAERSGHRHGVNEETRGLGLNLAGTRQNTQGIMDLRKRVMHMLTLWGAQPALPLHCIQLSRKRGVFSLFSLSSARRALPLPHTPALTLTSRAWSPPPVSGPGSVWTQRRTGRSAVNDSACRHDRGQRVARSIGLMLGVTIRRDRHIDRDDFRSEQRVSSKPSPARTCVNHTQAR